MNRKTSKNKESDIQKATVRTPVEKLRGKETIEHYNAVLLEDIRSKMELVIEGMEGTKESIKKDMQHLEKRLTGEIELLRGVVHRNSTDIFFLNSSQINSNHKVEESALQVVEINKKIEAVQNQITQMETNLSDKIDTIGTRLDDHEAKPANIAHRAA